jgi:hypothetical protein
MEVLVGEEVSSIPYPGTYLLQLLGMIGLSELALQIHS